VNEQTVNSLSAAFHAMQEGLGIFDFDLKLIICNESFISIREYPKSLCQPGVPLADQLRFNAERGDYGDIDVETLVGQRIAQVLKLKPHEIERRLPDGRTIIVRYTPIASVGVLCTFVDISNLKAAEGKIAEMARLPEQNPEPVLRLNGDGTLLYFNSAAKRLVTDLGLKLDDRAPSQWIEQFTHARQSEARISMPVEIGGRSYILTFAAVKGANKFNIYGQDTTELTEALQMVEALAKLPEQNPGPVLRFGAGFDFQYANPAAADLVQGLALSPGTAPPDEWQHAMQQSASTNAPLEFEVEFDQKVYALLAVPVSGTELTNIYGRDITERKAAEDELRQARDMAQEALERLQSAQQSLVQAEKLASLGQLVAGIAHEIKNPLNFVNNFANLSADLLSELQQLTTPAFDVLSKDDRENADDLMRTIIENLNKIEEHGRRADNIIKVMLGHSREGPGLVVPTDLNALLEESLNLAYHGMRASHSDLNVTLHQDFDPSQPTIECYPQELTRVFLNLAGNGLYALRQRNAEESSNSYEPCLSISSQAQENGVEVRIRDNGTGMPAHVVEKIFNPFFTTKPTGEGTGLGLSLSFDTVVQQHGGKLEVDTKQGDYTEFIVSLPYQFSQARSGEKS
jgi:signal transduction histidine kinase